MRSVLTVIGARPQFVKAAVVSRALADLGINEALVHTGQHYDAMMSAVFFEDLGIPAPRHHLGVGSGNHGAQTGAMLAGIEQVLLEDRPDWVLVYGDTNSTMAGALAAAKHHIPIAHVEAGMRSFNRRMPEEINRLVTDHLSSLLLCPTATSVRNLEAEGLVTAGERQGFSRRIEQVGDVMFDAAIEFGRVAAGRSTIMATQSLSKQQFALVTIHRAENTDDPVRLRTIVAALREIAESLPVVWPVHPRTRKVLESAGGMELVNTPGLRVIDPVGYLDMLQLEAGARCIITDSGGVQREAFFAGVPCVTLRDETEWTELVEAGWNLLVSPIAPRPIVEAVMAAAPGRTDIKPYGDGQASRLIARLLLDG